MKANELRIGNYINYCGSVKQLDAELFLQLLKYTTPFDLIQLTEEWLLKLGFEKDGIEWYWMSKKDRITTTGYAYSIEKKMLEFNEIEIPVQFVHQLQNLYFALTGEELKSE